MTVKKRKYQTLFGFNTISDQIYWVNIFGRSWEGGIVCVIECVQNIFRFLNKIIKEKKINCYPYSVNIPKCSSVFIFMINGGFSFNDFVKLIHEASTVHTNNKKNTKKSAFICLPVKIIGNKLTTNLDTSFCKKIIFFLFCFTEIFPDPTTSCIQKI